MLNTVGDWKCYYYRQKDNIHKERNVSVYSSPTKLETKILNFLLSLYFKINHFIFCLYNFYIMFFNFLITECFKNLKTSLLIFILIQIEICYHCTILFLIKFHKTQFFILLLCIWNYILFLYIWTFKLIFVIYHFLIILQKYIIHCLFIVCFFIYKIILI